MKVLRISYIFFSFIILLSIFSCTDEKVAPEINYETTNVSFDIGLDQLESNNTIEISDVSNAPFKTTAINRGRAPSYIKGISITATHKLYKNEDGTPVSITEHFDFDDDYSSSSLTAKMDIALGENIITIKTIPKDDERGNPIIGYNQPYYNLPMCSASTSQTARVRYYSDILINKQPIYLEYTGKKEVNIQKVNSPISIDMSTTQGRLNVVFENISRYPSAYIVNYINRGLFYLEMPIVGAGSASACVLNRADLSENTLEIVVKCFNSDSSGDLRHTYIISSGLEIRKGVNRTVVFRLNKDY